VTKLKRQPRKARSRPAASRGSHPGRFGAPATRNFADAIVEFSADAIAAIDRTGKFISWNKGAEQLYGYTAKEIIGQSVSRLIPPDRVDELSRKLKQVRRGKKIVGYETVRLRKDGQQRDVSITISPIRSAAGVIIGSSAVFRDITEHKQAMQSLQDSEHRISSIVENLADCLITIDERGMIESVNPAATTVFGFRPAELIGCNVQMLMPPPARNEHDQHISRYLRTGRARIIGARRELQGQRKDRTVFPIELTVSECAIGGRRKFIGIIRDITERKRLEGEIQHISEIEKQRLGRDLHDGLSQQLTAVRLLASDLESALVERSLPEARDAARIVRELEQAGRQTHDLARGLFPVVLQRGSIVPALQELAATVADLFRIKCEVAAPRDIRLADPVAARQLYRIAQEAINNAIKHSHGHHVWVQLVECKGRIILTVKDDGVGISKKALKYTDMGLRIMQYRAGILHADLTVTRARGGGTLVTCSFAHPTVNLPLEREP